MSGGVKKRAAKSGKSSQPETSSDAVLSARQEVAGRRSDYSSSVSKVGYFFLVLAISIFLSGTDRNSALESAVHVPALVGIFSFCTYFPLEALNDRKMRDVAILYNDDWPAWRSCMRYVLLAAFAGQVLSIVVGALVIGEDVTSTPINRYWFAGSVVLLGLLSQSAVEPALDSSEGPKSGPPTSLGSFLVRLCGLATAVSLGYAGFLTLTDAFLPFCTASCWMFVLFLANQTVGASTTQDYVSLGYTCLWTTLLATLAGGSQLVQTQPVSANAALTIITAINGGVFAILFLCTIFPVGGDQAPLYRHLSKKVTKLCTELTKGVVGGFSDE